METVSPLPSTCSSCCYFLFYFVFCFFQGRYGLKRFLRDGYKTPMEVGIYHLLEVEDCLAQTVSSEIPCTDCSLTGCCFHWLLLSLTVEYVSVGSL